MIRDHERSAFVQVRSLPEPAERLGRTQQRARRKRPERDDNCRIYQLELPEKERRALLDFLGQRVPIPRRATLQDVADKHAIPAQADGRQQAVEKLARLPDKWQSGRVLSLARSFADTHHASVGCAIREHGPCPGLVQLTSLAGVGHGSQTRQIRDFQDFGPAAHTRQAFETGVQMCPGRNP